MLFHRHDLGTDQFVELWKFAIEISVATFEHLILMTGTHASTRVFSIASVELLDDIHAFDNLPKGSEGGFDVVASVVTKVDVDLGGPSVGSGVGEADVAESVVLLERIVGNGDGALLLGDLRVAGDSELDPTTWDYTEEA